MSSRHCIVCGFTSGSGIGLHEFPLFISDGQRRMQWLKQLRLTEADLTRLSCVCSSHFEEQYLDRMPRQIRLRPNAVPTINLKLSTAGKEVQQAFPYIGHIDVLQTGGMVKVSGHVPPHAKLFAINLLCGSGMNPCDDIALHISARFEGNLSRAVTNSLQSQQWGVEENFRDCPFGLDQHFEMLILAKHDHFKDVFQIAINNEHSTEFRHRLPLGRVNTIAFDGDIQLFSVRYDPPVASASTIAMAGCSTIEPMAFDYDSDIVSISSSDHVMIHDAPSTSQAASSQIIFHAETTPLSSQSTEIPISGGSSQFSKTSSGETIGSIGYIPSPTPRERFQQKTTTNLRLLQPQAIYFIMEENLRLLFRRCQECGEKIEENLVRFYGRGAQLRVELFCGHCNKEIVWHSSPHIKAMGVLNIIIPAALVTSGKTYTDLKHFAAGCNLMIPSKQEFNNVCNSYIYPCINRIWARQSEALLDEGRRKYNSDQNYAFKIAMDTRFNRPGFTARYATTSAMDLENKKIISSIVTTRGVDKATSPPLEVEGTIYVLNSILSSHQPIDPDVDESQDAKTPIRIATVVTDESPSLKSEMRKEPYKSIKHQGDVWHFVKRIKKRLTLKSEKSQLYCDLMKWVKSICNFIWTICQECHGDPDLLVEIWKSILHHVSGRHSWSKGIMYGSHGLRLDKIDHCLHAELDDEHQQKIDWLSVRSPSYKYLESIIFDQKLIESLRRCSDFLHTSEVESFHSALLKNVPKCKPFKRDAFTARTHMTILHFNENIGRPSERNVDGSIKTRMVLPLSTKTWTLKRKLKDPTYVWRQNIIDSVLERRQVESSVPGHRLYQRQLQTEPYQSSFVPRPDRKELEESFNKRQKTDLV